MKIMDFINYLNYCKDTLDDRQGVIEFISKVVQYPKEDVTYWVQTYWKKANFGKKVYNTYIQDTALLYDRILKNEIKVITTYSIVYPVVEECKRLVDSGSKLQAVKLYKDYSGLGLKEAKDFIDAL